MKESEIFVVGTYMTLTGQSYFNRQLTIINLQPKTIIKDLEKKLKEIYKLENHQTIVITNIVNLSNL